MRAKFLIDFLEDFFKFRHHGEAKILHEKSLIGTVLSTGSYGRKCTICRINQISCLI